jgi:E3 ubiquitin-protein ligase TRIP12
MPPEMVSSAARERCACARHSANSIDTCRLETQQQKHKERLASIKADIDNKEPQRFTHLESRVKRNQQLEERYQQIERENRILLEKMSYIMTHSAVDQDGGKLPRPRSLNASRRRREMQRIMEENQRILERIQAQRAFYNRRQWEDDAKKHEELVRRICDQPLSDAAKSGRKPSRAPSAAAKKGARASNVRGRARDPLEHPLLKEGRHIGDKYVIVTMYEFAAPHILSVRTYDIDSSEVDRLDVAFAELEKMVPPEMLSAAPDKREDLCQLVLANLRLKPRLSLAKNLSAPEASFQAAPPAPTASPLRAPQHYAAISLPAPLHIDDDRAAHRAGDASISSPQLLPNPSSPPAPSASLSQRNQESKFAERKESATAVGSKAPVEPREPATVSAPQAPAAAEPKPEPQRQPEPEPEPKVKQDPLPTPPPEPAKSPFELPPTPTPTALAAQQDASAPVASAPAEELPKPPASQPPVARQPSLSAATFGASPQPLPYASPSERKLRATPLGEAIRASEGPELKQEQPQQPEPLQQPQPLQQPASERSQPPQLDVQPPVGAHSAEAAASGAASSSEATQAPSTLQ